MFINVGIKTAVQTDYRLHKNQYFKEGTFLKQTTKTLLSEDFFKIKGTYKQDIRFSLQYDYSLNQQFGMCVRFLAIFKYLQMELNKKIQEGPSCHAIKISSMEVDGKYPILHAERVITKFGPTVLLSIKDSNSYSCRNVTGVSLRMMIQIP